MFIRIVVRVDPAACCRGCRSARALRRSLLRRLFTFVETIWDSFMRRKYACACEHQVNHSVAVPSNLAS